MLTVEDGSVVANADSYATLNEFYVYCDKVGRDYSAMSNLAIEQNLRKAFYFLVQKYRHNIKGFRKDANQVGDWPRTNVYITNTISNTLVSDSIVPIEFKYAQIELAIRANTSDLMEDLEQQILKVVIGPIEVQNDSRSQQNKRYPAIDAMLWPYLENVNSLTRRAQRA